jgi:hypothetical protein
MSSLNNHAYVGKSLLVIEKDGLSLYETSGGYEVRQGHNVLNCYDSEGCRLGKGNYMSQNQRLRADQLVKAEAGG